ncbi:hypothetical protein EV121DRAFT_294720 [Schizophyllum commune]
MDGVEHDKEILQWDENDVQAWLKSIGFPQYEQQIRENNITGDVLVMLNAESLKEFGVATIGQRVAILKAVYQLKIAQNVPIEPDDYVPPSEAAERGEVTLEKLQRIIKEQGEKLERLQEENKAVREELHSFQSDFVALRHSLYVRPDDGNASLRRGLSVKIGSGAALDSPHPSPQLDREAAPSYNHSPPNTQSSSPPSTADKNTRPSAVASSSTAPPPDPVIAPRPTRQDSSDNLKSFKVSLEDPTWKVLPAALKKYRINNDNWQNYAMFICYGSPGNRIERCLSYDEKPLLLFQKLKDAKKNPVFMLKHIKDIRSPIAVAQQKHAARKASSVVNESTGTPTTNNGPSHAGTSTHTKQPSVARHRPPKLEVHDLSTPQPPLTGTSAGPGAWPTEGGVSPNTEVGPRLNVTSDDQAISPGGANTPSLGGRSPPGTSDGHASSGSASGREIPPTSSRDVSYAVAIYPYMAEQDDEFDVVVGDTFVILSRSRGWWVVQRDPTGSGAIDPDIKKQAWVPAGCLLETSVPVASAIAEATAATQPNGSSQPSTPSRQQQRTPILPLSIISTSFPGIALMDYAKKGEEELELAKDDALRVFKRYNHWSYAVKEDTGDRGWVPSWYIGKAATAPQTPGPNTSNSAIQQQQTISVEDTPSQQPQISPMSSAFPGR